LASKCIKTFGDRASLGFPGPAGSLHLQVTALPQTSDPLAEIKGCFAALADSEGRARDGEQGNRGGIIPYHQFLDPPLGSSVVCVMKSKKLIDIDTLHRAAACRAMVIYRTDVPEGAVLT